MKIMMARKIGVLFLTLGLILGSTFSPFVDRVEAVVQEPPAETIVVNTTADTSDIDPGDGECLDFNEECSFRAAIQESNALEGLQTIEIPEGVYTMNVYGTNEDESATGDFDITDDVVIIGAGQELTTLDGQSAFIDRVLHILPGVTATISGIRVTGGFGGYNHHGGGILNEGNLELTDVTIDNSFAGEGGGLYNNGNAILQEVTIRDNGSVTQGDNTYYSTGGGIAQGTGGNLTLNHTAVVSNVAEFAGGIYNWGGQLTIINGSSVSGNEAIDSEPADPYYGGGYYGGLQHGASYNSEARLTITDSTIENNTAVHNGGGIQIGGNSGTTAHIERTTIIGNNAENGGALYLENYHDTVILDSVIEGNHASMLGGGIYFSENSNTSFMTISDSVFLNNILDTEATINHIYNESPTMIHAAKNWWGDAAGPGDTIGGQAIETVPFYADEARTLLVGPPEYLRELEVSEGWLTPAFDTNITEYTLDVGMMPTIDITALPFNPEADLFINNQSVSHGEPFTVALDNGENHITIEVSYLQEVRSYHLNVHRKALEFIYDSSFPEWGLQTPFDTAIDSDGNIYVVDSWNDAIIQLDSDGNVINTFSDYVDSENEYRDFRFPFAMTIDEDDDLYIAQGAMDGIPVTLLKMTREGQFIYSVELGQSFVSDMAIDHTGNLLLTVPQEGIIQVNAETGEIIGFIQTIDENEEVFGPIGIAVDHNNDILFTNYSGMEEMTVTLNTYSSTEGISEIWNSPSTSLEDAQFEDIFMFLMMPAADTEIDDEGNIYVANPFTNTIVKMDSSGSNFTEFTDIVMFPQSIAVDGEGVIYSIDGRNFLSVLDPTSMSVEGWGIGLNEPKSISIADGLIYVSDNNLIKVFNPQGEASQVWTMNDSGHELLYIDSIEADQQDNKVYMLSSEMNSLIVTNKEGDIINKLVEFNNGDTFYGPSDIAISQEYLYVVDSQKNRVVQFDRSLQFVNAWGEYGQGEEQFMYPDAIAVDSKGQVYVTDGSQIKKYDAQGAFITSWEVGDNGNSNPESIAVSPNDYIFVADNYWGGKSIQVYDREGNFVNKFQSEILDQTKSLAFDDQGQLYVTDASYEGGMVHKIVIDYGSDENEILGFKEGHVIANVNAQSIYSIPAHIRVAELVDSLMLPQGASAKIVFTGTQQQVSADKPVTGEMSLIVRAQSGNERTYSLINVPALFDPQTFEMVPISTAAQVLEFMRSTEQRDLTGDGVFNHEDVWVLLNQIQPVYINEGLDLDF